MGFKKKIGKYTEFTWHSNYDPLTAPVREMVKVLIA